MGRGNKNTLAFCSIGKSVKKMNQLKKNRREDVIFFPASNNSIKIKNVSRTK